MSEDKIITSDDEAWAAFPHHRLFYNKLWLSEQLGYICGPAGYTPPEHEVPDNVIVRPIYNLSGMGVGTNQINVLVYQSAHRVPDPDDVWMERNRTKGEVVAGIPPGTFWCEMFEGEQTSTTYRWSDANGWLPDGTYLAEGVSWDYHGAMRSRQQRVKSWKRVPDPNYSLPKLFDQLADVRTINVERIGDKIIEVHLRDTPDPQADVFVPIFEGDESKIVDWTRKGYTFVYSYDDANGHLTKPRKGFMVRNP